MIHYLAYGSNLHPVRLTERVSSANLVGVVELGEHRLTFHKKSDDASSKCNLFHTGCGSDSAYGAIYAIDPAHKGVLDRFEGKGYGYTDARMKLRHQGRQYHCFTYIAQQSHIVDHLKPYHWYKKLVVLGARYLQFPDPYVLSIESVQSVADPDTQRAREKKILIRKIIDHR